MRYRIFGVILSQIAPHCMVSDMPKTQIIGEPAEHYIQDLIIEDKYIYVRPHFSGMGMVLCNMGGVTGQPFKTL